MKSPIWKTADRKVKTTDNTSPRSITPRGMAEGSRPRKESLMTWRTLVMFSLLSLGAALLLHLSGPHWILRMITIGLYLLYSFILVTRQEGPDFRDAWEVLAPNVAGRTAKADPSMAQSSAPDKNRTPRLAVDSKLIVYCFRTKRRI